MLDEMVVMMDVKIGYFKVGVSCVWVFFLMVVIFYVMYYYMVNVVEV